MLLNDVGTNVDAAVTNENTRACNQNFDFRLILSAERAVQKLLVIHDDLR